MEKEKFEIDFKPLTSGLGFHPFSDGLPYAPISQTPTATPKATAKAQATPSSLQSGAGATVAGTPTFVTRPRLSTTTSPSAPVQRVNVPVATKAPQQQKKVETLAPKTAQTQAQTQPQRQTQPKLGFGYLFKRMVAYLFDTLVNVSLAAGSFAFVLWNQNLQPDLLFNSGVILIAALFFFVFSWAIMTAQEIAFGTTLGKRLFGFTLHGTTTALFLRAFFFLPSAGFLGVGLLWGLLDSRKRCWHDLIVNVQPLPGQNQ